MSLTITEQSDYFTAKLSDNGLHFKPDMMKFRGGHQGGYGLFSIQERTLALGGVFEVDSSPGSGCRFVHKIPIDSKDMFDDKLSENKAHLEMAVNDETEEAFKMAISLR